MIHENEHCKTRYTKIHIIEFDTRKYTAQNAIHENTLHEIQRQSALHEYWNIFHEYMLHEGAIHENIRHKMFYTKMQCAKYTTRTRIYITQIRTIRKCTTWKVITQDSQHGMYHMKCIRQIALKIFTIANALQEFHYSKSAIEISP